MLSFRQTPPLVGFMVAMAGLQPVSVPGPTASAQRKQPTSDAEPGVALPASAIIRLGTPQPKSNTGGLYVAFLSDGHTVVSAGSRRRTLDFWDVRTGKRLRSMDDHLFVIVSPDGKAAVSRSGWRDARIRLLDLNTGKEDAKIVGLGLAHFCFSADSRYLAVSGVTADRGPDAPRLRILEVATAKEIQRLPLVDPLYAVNFSRDGRLLVTGKAVNLPPVVQAWDVATGKALRSFEGHRNDIFYDLQMSPDGTLLAGASGEPRVWDVGTGKERWRVFRNPESSLSVAFSPNGQMLAIGAVNDIVHVYESTTGRERTVIKTGVPATFSLAFSPCGLMLATIGRDAAPLVWDVTGVILGGRDAGAPLSANELEACWTDLARLDAAKAWQAIRKFGARPVQAVPILKNRLNSRKSKLAPKALAQMLAGLDADDFATREEAYAQLEHLGPAVAPALEKLRAKPPSVEAKRRADDLLARIAKSELVSEDVLRRRVLETLEYIGTPAATEVLQREAQTEPGSPLAQAAKSALDRIAKRLPRP